MPMPEAQARGLLAKRPMKMVMMPAPTQVEVTAAFMGTPAAASSEGLTAMMYAMARKVVSPARTSCPVDEPLSPILKNFSTSSSFLPEQQGLCHKPQTKCGSNRANR